MTGGPWRATLIVLGATGVQCDDVAMNGNQAVGLGVAVFGATLRVRINLETVREPA